MKPTTKPIEIFKPGRHTAMAGTVLDYSDADLAACAAAYDPDVFRAPIVVGHPKLTDPAFGHIDKVEYANGRLRVTQGEIDADFADVVDRKHYTKVSASFFLPDAPNHPKPGTLYLRHVGFLGAIAPAVKGLAPVEFSDSEEGIVTFADWGDMQNASLWRRLREWMIGEKGLEVADNIIPDYAVASLEDDARSEDDTPTLSPAFADPKEQQVTPEQAAALEAENTRLKAEAATRTEADRKALIATRHAAHVSFADSLVSDARVLPKDKDAVVALLDHAATPVNDNVVEFGEGDDKKPLVDIAKGLFAALPATVDFGESATRERAADGTNTGTVEFAAPDGFGVDATQLALHNKVLAHAAKHNVTYTVALAAVAK